jgi:hypothetical protein
VASASAVAAGPVRGGRAGERFAAERVGVGDDDAVEDLRGGVALEVELRAVLSRACQVSRSGSGARKKNSRFS